MNILTLVPEVVAPVAAELLFEPLQSLTITQSSNADEAKLSLAVKGETFHFWVLTPGQAPESVAELRVRFASQLQDWIAESGFGWGELRPHTSA